MSQRPDSLSSAAFWTERRLRFIKSCDGAHVRLEEGRPRLGSGGVTTLTVRAFGIGSDCSFHRVYVADFTTFWIASPSCAERRAPVQAAFIGRQLLFTASDWGTTEGASPNSPPPRAGSRRPHPSCWRSRQDLNTDLEWL